MATNRFYTPALPQYTSQFVEDRTPWQAMLALNQQKIGRADAALAGAAQAQSQFSSLMPGFHTQDIVPGVVSDYEQQLAQWQEKHGQHIYSVPAMRDLTKIQGQFQADPRVKMVQQDVQQTPMIQQAMAQQDYRPETDPNRILDPDTGEYKFRQFGSEDTFTPWQRPVYMGNLAEEMDERFGTIDADIFQGEPKIDYAEDESGARVPYFRQDTYSGLSGERELLEGQTQMGRYYKQLYGDDWNIDKARDLIMQQESKYYKTKQLIDSKFIPTGKSGSGKDDFPTGLTFDASAQPMIPPDNIGGEPQQPLRKTHEIFSNLRNRAMKFGKDDLGQQFYDEVKEDPEALLNETVVTKEGKEIPMSSTLMNKTGVIKESMYTQPYTTMMVWDDYFNNLPEGHEHKKEEAKTRKLIDRYAKEFKVGDPKFNNE